MDKTRQEILEAIKDKARGFCNTQEIIIIRTIPSTKYPKGAKYEGWIRDVSDLKIDLWDTFIDKPIPIYFSDIASPQDLWAKLEVKK